MTEHLLEVEGLRVELASDAVPLVHDASFTLAAGSVLGLVGESGSGKSLTLRAILGLLPKEMVVAAGRIDLGGSSVWAADESARRRLRGRVIGLVPQEPLSALNPLKKIGRQVSEAPKILFGQSRRQARVGALEVLDRVGLRDVERVANSYPHELSGGMRQRATIAMALACSPRLLLCDEPTTAVDAAIQGRVLDLLRSLAVDQGVGVVIVTHDLSVVARSCDDVAVMYAGTVVERARTAELLQSPVHPYTRALLRALPGGPDVDDLEPIPGAPPEPAMRPSGCPFHPRCSYATAACGRVVPQSRAVGAGRSVACTLVPVANGKDSSNWMDGDD